MNSRSNPDKIIFFLCAQFLLCLLIFSCADSEPRLSDSKIYAVFEYSDYETFPKETFALSIKTSADVRRAGKLTVKKGSLTWTTTSPEIIENPSGQTVSYTNFRPAPSHKIQPGFYSIDYTDLAGREATGLANLSFPPEISSSTVQNAVKLMQSQQKSAVQNIAIYDDDGQLLYLGKSKANWLNDVEILREFRSAAKKRTVYQSTNPNFIVILPADEIKSD